MPFATDSLDAAAAWFAAGLWVLLVAIYFIGRHDASPNTARRSRVSQLGLVLQVAAYVVPYVWHRPFFAPLLPMTAALDRVVVAIATAIGIASIWLCYAAARALGKQWALTARVVEGHELIVRGPYRLVRNPIYLAMFGLLLDAGLTTARWDALVAAIAIFLAGTWVRIHQEEAILRATFGAKFDEYARRVPALLPGIF